MVQKDGKTHLHVTLKEDEFKMLENIRGDEKWKPFLLSIPRRLREAADKLENAQLKLKLAEIDNNQLLKTYGELEEKYRVLEARLEQIEGKRDG